jgi:integrase
VIDVPTLKLTQPAVERLKPPASGRVEYWDSQLPGFGLRISASGRKSWVVMYRVSGKLVRETLGTITATPNVGEARELPRASFRKAQQGTNPVAERRAQERAQQQATAETFRAVSALFVERYAKQNTKESTWRELQRQLDVDVNPHWGDRPIRSITRRDVVELLDGIADRGAPVQANRTLARLRTLFNWAVDREIIATSPLARMKLPTVEKERSRTLSDDEIRLFWRACERLGWPFGPMCQLLLLTAQRRTEVAGMRWSEIDIERGLWTIPRERAKNDREHLVNLSDFSIKLLDMLPRVQAALADGMEAPPADFIFTTTGQSHVSGYSKAKERLDQHLRDLSREQAASSAEQPRGVGEWIFHDLRRTAATGMARLNVPPQVVDRILNHVSGTIRGVAAVYNRHAYLEERRAALDLWSHHIQELIAPTK